MASLPIRIRQNIRDHVTSQTSPLALKFEAVKSVLGYPVNFDPEWKMLWKSLQAYYPDNSTFIPSNVSTVITWCIAFTEWLERDESKDCVAKLLEELKTKCRLDLAIGVVPSSVDRDADRKSDREQINETSKRPTTTWQSNKCVFVIGLPLYQLPQEETVLAGFATDFLDLFPALPIITATSVVAIASPKVSEDEQDGWALLDPKSTKTETVTVTGGAHPSISHQAILTSTSRPSAVDDHLPKISTIPRPEELTLRAPYWLVVRQENKSKVVIHGSHGPSLACLGEYLKRWCRGDSYRVDRPPVVDITLHESLFGLGLLHDTLTLEAVRGREVSAMLVLVFVENVLGYSPTAMSGSAGSVWEFKRLNGFK